MTSSQTNVSQSHGHQRSKACKPCHDKKVRCNVSAAHIPCSKCKESGAKCVVRIRKPYTARSSRREWPRASVGNNSNMSQLPVESRSGLSELLATPIAKDRPEDVNITHIFVGESHGIASLLDAVETGRASQRQHLLVPRSTARALQPEDLNYLKEKGAFSLPTLQICNALVESYFCHVHVTIPIIDEASFLKAYSEGGVQRVNLLLLWSMFSASASYVAESVVRESGHATKVQMKESFLKRAKSLFHLSGEDDKIVLIQSALLISFWFCDTDDIMQTWHWSGIAFGLAQTMGLHKDPDAKPRNSSVSDQYRRVWRRVWWSCVIRDGWLAFLMGRPLRINCEDCNCPTPTETDFTDCAQETDTTELLRLWLSLLELTKVLRDILTLIYRQLSKPEVPQITAFESLINYHAAASLESTAVSPILTFHRLQLQLYQQVALIALFHPYCRHPTSQRITNTGTVPLSVAADKVREAASRTNTIVDQIITMNGIKYFGPVTVSLLPPAMQVHLMESKSSKTLNSQLATTKLDVCLMVLAELRDNYPSATILHELFRAAKASVIPTSYLTSPSSVSVGMTSSSNTPTPTGMLQEPSQTLFMGNMFPLTDFPLYPSSSNPWQIETDLPFDASLNAIIRPEDLNSIFA